ncbi:MAG: site-2 protease family protein [Eubacteriales bacterium]|nr:site-2 protease family protein [Eubacteriales bacterium]
MTFTVTPAAAVLFPLLYLLDDSGLTAALLPAVFAHEMGHFLALRVCRARVTVLRLDILGLQMDYRGVLDAGEEVLCALAGPAAGLLFAGAASLVGRRTGSGYFSCTAGISFLLSCFNLLPALPLDGGRAVLALCGGRRSMVRIGGIATAAVFLTAGFAFAVHGLGCAALLPGTVFLMQALFPDGDFERKT